jgi:anti-sigma B factor antagonist
MSLAEHKQGAVTVLKPEGPLLGKDAEDFRARLLQSLTASFGRCVVDASAIPFVDSKGLEALADASDTMASSGHSLKLCGVTETVRQAFELTQLTPRFEYFEDVHAAVRSFL